MVIISTIILLWIAAVVAWSGRAVLPTSPLRGWLLAAFPAASFGILLWLSQSLGNGPLLWSIPWIDNGSLSIHFSFYVDHLSALFGLLVTGIGSMIMIYAGYYFSGDGDAGRFLAYLFLFMGMMLGLVLAGDIITLFLFWEGTSITSFLLVAYKYKYEEARKGAFRALFITGGGGIALLAGLLFVSNIAGSTSFETLLTSGDLVRSHPLYLAALGLVAFGAFTKSAQFPAHIWLPGAMSAPTPASAFLHSATMVKAGIYLLARLNPTLGQTEAWFWLLTIVGMVTMLVGAYLGTQQDDLKALLAYSTISQLGILMMLIGNDTEIAFKALIIGIIAHAFYKCALFMLVGIIDHETGTRLISRLGGLRGKMPRTFILVSIGALSLAGLPPLFGFLAKETLLATAVHPSLPVAVSWILAGAVVVAAAFKLVQAGLVALEVFTGESRDEAIFNKAHEAPFGMLLPPAIPVLISLALGILPEPAGIAKFFGYAAEAAHGSEVKVSFALWTGLNIPFFLSIIAISSGVVLFWQRERLISWQKSIPTFSFNRVYEGSLRMVDGAAWLATRLQNGMLRLYLGVMILTMLGLVVLFGGVGLLTLPNAGEVLEVGSGIDFSPIRLLSLIATVGAALATIFIRRDFFAILALGASGLGVAVYMAVEPAPDVALVQIVVDILATVILILAISRLPRAQRMQANLLNNRVQGWPLFISIAGAALMTLITYSALITRPRTSLVSPFYSENSKGLTGADDIVGAIIIDFRALDTLIEIAVFALAGLGIFTLIQYASKKHGDARGYKNPIQGAALGSGVNSIYLKAIANLLLPVTMVVGAIHMLLGHNQPGDGFTAGVIISLGIGFKYVVFGFSETRRRLWWLHPKALIGTGVLLVIGSGIAGGLLNGSFLSPVDYGGLLGIPMPTGMKLSSGFLFEVAIALAVMGSVSLMLDTLGKPAINMVDVKTESDEPTVVTAPLAPQLVQASRKKPDLQIQTGGD